MISGESVLNGGRATPKTSKSLITTAGGSNMKRDMPPIHPGEILLEDFLKPLGITQYRLAKSIGVPQRRIGEIIAGKRSVTADTALRLARFFGTDAQSWVNLQAHYDLEIAKERLEGRLEKEVTPMTHVA
jgi:addiction module HigA family antidote